MKKVYVNPQTKVVQFNCESMISLSSEQTILEVDNESTDNVSGDSNTDRWSELW